MRTHGNQTNLKTVNPYSAAAEKAMAMQRAVDVRTNLMTSGSEIEDTASPEEATLLSKWMSRTRGEAQVEVEYQTAVAGRDSDFALVEG